MRPRRYLERNRDCVRAGFAPGRPPPVHPRLTGACAAMRGFQICVSDRAQMQRPPSAWPALRPSSRCQTARCAAWFRAARLFPATHFCARAGLDPFAPDPKRGGRSADRRTISFVAFARRDWSARVRRGASHDAGRSPLGAPPWRFSAGGRASISGIASGSVQRAPRSQVVVPGGRCPGPPEPAVTSRGRRTPLPAPPFRTVSGRRPSMSEDGNLCTINSLRSQ
jgi:hypothetical protein